MAFDTPIPETADTRAPDGLRPRILLRAAAHVARHYRRRRDLPGALPGQGHLAGEALLARLAAAEAKWEGARRTGLPGYRPARHVQVLGALLAERRG